MNLMTNIFSLYNNTPRDDIYHIALKNIFKHLDEMESYTTSDLAEVCTVSKATLVRLTQKLGYDSLSNFRHDISQAYQKHIYYNRILLPEMLESDNMIVSSYLESMQNIITYLQQNLDIGELNKIADAMHNAKTIKFYSAGKIFSEIALQINLTMDKKETLALSRYAEQLEDVKTLDNYSVAFITSSDVINSVDMFPIFKEASDNGARIVLLTHSTKSQYQKYAEFLIISKGPGTMISSYGLNMYLDILNEIYRKKYIDKY